MRQIRILEAEVRQVEEKVWETRGVPANVLITQAQGLAAACAGGNKTFVDEVLNRMIETIKELQPDASGVPRLDSDVVEVVLDIWKKDAVQKMGGTKFKELRELLVKTPTRKSDSSESAS